MDILEQDFQEAVKLDDIPGIIATGRDASGSFNYAKAVGNRTLLDGSKKPYEVGNVIAIYSATKLITSIAVLQCVEKGLFTLDEDVGRVLPHFKDIKVLTGFDGDKPLYEDKQKPVTLRHLMTHSAGMAYEVMQPNLAKWREQNGGQAAAMNGKIAVRFAYPLVFQPGSQFAYGPGLDWAGKAVEQVTQMTLEQYFHAHIFTPLGVNHASFFPMQDAALRERMVDLNPEDPNGVGLAPMGGIPSQVGVEDCFGGQGLYMPVEEYVKILHSVLIDDGKLLPPKSVEIMFEPSLEPGAYAALNAALDGVITGTPMGAGLPRGSRCDYAVSGLLVQSDPPEFYSRGTITWGGAFNSSWFIDRRAGLCGYGAPQLYLRDAPMTRGEGYVFKPHREGALQWEAMAEHYKNLYRRDIYKLYRDSKVQK